MNSEPTGEASAPPRVWSPSARLERLALSPPLRRHPSTESVSRLVGVALLGERSDGAARLTRESAITASGATGVSDLLSVTTNVPLPSAGVSPGAVLRQPVDIPATEARRSILGALSTLTGGDTAMVSSLGSAADPFGPRVPRLSIPSTGMMLPSASGRLRETSAGEETCSATERGSIRAPLGVASESEVTDMDEDGRHQER
jgi:hypothetical protein